MFHPVDHPLERGWVGRIDGERVIQLAAQTLQSFFTGGGSAREHAVYALDGVRLLAPVLHPPAVRVFDDQDEFAFANPAAVVGPGAAVAARPSEPGNAARESLALLPRLAGVIGAEGAIAGFTALADWRDPGRTRPKDRDFALGLGPVLVTTEELDSGELAARVRVDGDERLRGAFGGFDWEAARDRAAAGTTLRPGDLVAGPALGVVEEIDSDGEVEVEVERIGVLSQRVAA